MLKMMMRSKLKMLAMPRAKQRTMQRMPILEIMSVLVSLFLVEQDCGCNHVRFSIVYILPCSFMMYERC